MKTLHAILSNRRMFVILLLGFASGLPISLISSTLQAWLTDAGLEVTVLGLFSLVGMPYSLKFLWAPLMDRYAPPFYDRRRGWILMTQLGLIAALSVMAFVEPAESLRLLVVMSTLVAFLGASQDIVIDAYKVEVLEPHEYGLGAGVANVGYRLGMLFSGGLALILADHLSWRLVYLLMAAALLVGVCTTFAATAPTRSVSPPRNLKEAVLAPLVEFFTRPGAWVILLFITIYKLDVVTTLAFMTRFLMELGFTKSDIGAVTKGFGLFATLSGTMLGGGLLVRLGVFRALGVFGVLQGVSGLCFYFLAVLGHHGPMMVVTVVAESFFSGMGNAAYAALLMSLCNPRFTATQFALLTSLMGLTQKLVPVPAGWLVEAVGWPRYYLIAMALGAPGLLLLWRFRIGETPAARAT